MRGQRFERLLAASALAVIFAATSGLAASAGMTEERSIEAAIPVPEPANLPPPTAADVAQSRAASVPAEADIDARIPLPESANLPPPSLADVGGPVTGTTEAKVPDNTPAAAAAPAPTATPAATEAPASKDAAAPAPVQENPVTVAMRELVGSKLSRFVERKNDRTAVETFYVKRGFAPLWVENGDASARARAAIGYLASVDAEGLDPADYPTPVFRSGAEPTAIAEADIKMTAAVLTYARHAQSGRVHWTRVSADVFYGHQAPEPADVLAKIADATDISATLASFNPPHAGYQALKAKLAELRGHKGGSAAARIADGPLLKLGMHDNRVPLLRERLGVSGDANDTTYDNDVAEAVKAFQQKHKLKATGTLTAATLDAVNGPRRSSARDIDVVLANMERWRWLPRELSNASRAYVVLNVPDYTLRVYRDNAVVWQTRVVVGQPKTPTPILSETMKYITVNPTWNVPPSIVYNEYLPALQQDPTVLERMGLRLSQNRDGSVHISQPPGERNALGRIRFNFPNRFLVYQHDTPDKHLFAHDRRAYSHGCMRVQDPAKYAEVLFNIARPSENWTADRIKRMFGTGEQDIQLPVPIWVHLTYQNAFVDDAGQLQIRRDVYNIDSRTQAAIKSERDIVEPMQERKRDEVASTSSGQRRLAAPQAPRVVSFFEALFGGGHSQQA